MKQIFRRGKPPLRILDRGDVGRKHKKKILRPVAYEAPDGKILKRVCDMTLEEQSAIRLKANNAALEMVKIKLPHGTAVTVKVGEHSGETAVVIGPSKTFPGRLGVLTLGGIVHYKIEDLEVEK
jgi:hypothetical protein